MNTDLFYGLNLLRGMRDLRDWTVRRCGTRVQGWYLWSYPLKDSPKLLVKHPIPLKSEPGWGKRVTTVNTVSIRAAHPKGAWSTKASRRMEDSGTSVVSVRQPIRTPRQWHWFQNQPARLGRKTSSTSRSYDATPCRRAGVLNKELVRFNLNLNF